MRTLLAATLWLTTAACGSSEPKPASSPPPGHDQPAPAERPTMTVEECEARQGTVVGDIGDGAVHRPDYVCPSGEPPIGTVPSGIEGAVCCPGPAEPAQP